MACKAFIAPRRELCPSTPRGNCVLRHHGRHALVCAVASEAPQSEAPLQASPNNTVSHRTTILSVCLVRLGRNSNGKPLCESRGFLFDVANALGQTCDIPLNRPRCLVQDRKSNAEPWLGRGGLRTPMLQVRFQICLHADVRGCLANKQDNPNLCTD